MLDISPANANDEFSRGGAAQVLPMQIGDIVDPVGQAVTQVRFVTVVSQMGLLPAVPG